jgi:hypothetical protein
MLPHTRRSVVQSQMTKGDIALYWLGAHGAGEETCMSPVSSRAFLGLFRQVASRLGQWSPDQPVLCDRSPRPSARHLETVGRTAGSRDPDRTSSTVLSPLATRHSPPATGPSRASTYRPQYLLSPFRRDLAPCYDENDRADCTKATAGDGYGESCLGRACFPGPRRSHHHVTVTPIRVLAKHERAWRPDRRRVRRCGIGTVNTARGACPVRSWHPP